MVTIKMYALVLSVFWLALVSLLFGSTQTSLTQIYSALIQGADYSEQLNFVINQYRLPRLILALGVGAGLGLSGVMIQGIIRNPLASPDLMGISAGAGLAATLFVIYLPDAPSHYLAVAALCGGLATSSVILAIGYVKQTSPARMALIGIAISAFLSSGIDFLLITNPVEINTAMVWLTGSLWGRAWEQVPFIWILLAIMLPTTLWLAWRLDILGLGEESAISLGIKPSHVQFLALVCSVVLASISVSICGTISFVGLLAPHLARLLFGHYHKLLVISSAFIGAIMVLAADTLARTIHPPLELPAGVLTALIGAPYFMYLLHRYRGW